MKKCLFFAVVASAMLLSVNSCKKSVPATSLTTVKEATVMVDSTIQIVANIQPEGYTSALKWASSDNNTATVDDKGVVKGVSGGSCDIVAAIDGLQATTKLTVIPTPATVTLTASPMQTKAVITTTTSYEGATYAFAYVPKATADKMSDEQIISTLVSDKDFENYLTTKSGNITLVMLDPETEYVAFAFGYNTDYKLASNKLTRCAFKTNKLNASPTFEFTYDSIASVIEQGSPVEYAFFTVIPSDNTSKYMAAGATAAALTYYGGIVPFLSYLDYLYMSFGLDLSQFTVSGKQVLKVEKPETVPADLVIFAAAYNGDWTSSPCSMEWTYPAVNAPAHITSFDQSVRIPRIPMKAHAEKPKYLLAL